MKQKNIVKEEVNVLSNLDRQSELLKCSSVPEYHKSFHSYSQQEVNLTHVKEFTKEKRVWYATHFLVFQLTFNIKTKICHIKIIFKNNRVKYCFS